MGLREKNFQYFGAYLEIIIIPWTLVQVHTLMVGEAVSFPLDCPETYFKHVHEADIKHAE